jgi:peptide/nickel transport system permease protein
MLIYAVRRLLAAIPLIIAATSLVFVLTSLGGDPVAARLATCTTCDESAYQRLIEVYELDLPVYPQRYLSWLGDFVGGDMGVAISQGERPVADIVVERGINTMYIAVPAFVLIAVSALTLGVYQAVKQYSVGDYVITGISFLGISMPTFFFGLLLQAMVIWYLNATGDKFFNVNGMDRSTFVAYLQTATLPIITLALISIAGESRFQRAATLEVLNSDYIRTARAKGLPERTVIFKHALRNALIPLVTVWALDFALLLGGSVITETVFSWPGLGLQFITALTSQDLDLMMAVTMITIMLVVMFNLVADILYGVLDPRIRYD